MSMSEAEIEQDLAEALMTGVGAALETVGRVHEKYAHEGEFCNEHRIEMLAFCALRLRIPPEAFDSKVTITELKRALRDRLAELQEHYP